MVAIDKQLAISVDLLRLWLEFIGITCLLLASISDLAFRWILPQIDTADR